jgi:hypothetical protein
MDFQNTNDASSMTLDSVIGSNASDDGTTGFLWFTHFGLGANSRILVQGQIMSKTDTGQRQRLISGVGPNQGGTPITGFELQSSSAEVTILGVKNS